MKTVDGICAMARDNTVDSPAVSIVLIKMILIWGDTQYPLTMVDIRVWEPFSKGGHNCQNLSPLRILFFRAFLQMIRSRFDGHICVSQSRQLASRDHHLRTYQGIRVPRGSIISLIVIAIKKIWHRLHETSHRLGSAVEIEISMRFWSP